MPPDAPTEDATERPAAKTRRLWDAVRRWFVNNTFTPSFVPSWARKPFVGYLVAVLLQVAAIAVVVLLAEVLVGFAFPALLSILVVALIALTWGLGPALVAALTGVALLGGLLRSGVLHLNETGVGRAVALGLYLAVSGVLSALASQIVRARQDAQDRARRETEAAARLTATIDAMADGVLVYDRDEQVLRANTALRTFLSLEASPDAGARLIRERSSLLSPRDMYGRVMAPEQGPIHRVLRGEVLTNERTLDLRVRALDGTERYVSVSGAPVRDAAGDIIGGVLGVRDETERRRLEREVAAERERLREIFQHAPAGIALLTGPEHVFAFMNAAYARLSGRDPDALVGRPLRDAYPELVDQGFDALMDEVYRTGTPFVGTETLVRLDRAGDGVLDDVYFSFVYQPLRGVDGAVESILSNAVDVTAQVWARQRVEELAEERDRVRAEFVATVSHDLRQPLTAIRAGIGLVEMSARDRLTLDERALLEAARDNGDRLRAQIDDLLAVNAIEAGTLRLERAPLDLRDVVTRALGVVQPLLRERGQTLDIDLPEPLPLSGDAWRLEQVVTNLLSNAHRHTPAGTRVTVSGRAGRDEIALDVRDSGPGIPTAALEAVFERFYRVNHGAGGSGLGLSIVRAIVELHGGRVWAESEEGAGAAFHVVLPRDAVAVEVERAE